MKFRAKLTIAMVLLLSLTYGIGGSLMIAQSFSSSIDRERDAAVQTYRMVVDVLELLGDNASPGTAANTVALVLHKLGSGGSSTAARIRFGAQMTTTGDTALLDEAPEPPAGSGVTSIVHTGNGRHYLMLGATADGTTVQLAFDVTETYTVRQTQQRAYHTTFVILIVIGAAVSWLTSYLLTRPLGTLSRASRELARGNLGYRATVRSRDEVGQLAADFNRMAGQLERNVNRIQETMALQERFMADFSHEMKTPMTSIIGYADLLRSQVLTPDEQMDAANYIFSEGKRLEALGLKLLDMLSLDQSKLQLVPAHPADLVAGLLEHLKRLYAQKALPCSTAPRRAHAFRAGPVQDPAREPDGQRPQGARQRRQHLCLAGNAARRLPRACARQRPRHPAGSARAPDGGVLPRGQVALARAGRRGPRPVAVQRDRAAARRHDAV